MSDNKKNKNKKSEANDLKYSNIAEIAFHIAKLGLLRNLCVTVK